MIQGTEDLDNAYAQLLIQYMLKPFAYRRKDMIPSYDAMNHLESYFPTLFPYGKGGPTTIGLSLGVWVKHALLVDESKFAKHIDFIFFVHAVLRRKRLSGLAIHAPIRNVGSNALAEVQDLLSYETSKTLVVNRIDRIIRSGVLSASFETLRGTASFWSKLKRECWAYLAHFGSCQIFLTVSVADVIDPFVFMQVDKSLTVEDARKLSTKGRALLLAQNLVAATTVFHRRIQSLFDNFLFGKTKPFGEIKAFLGRIEQQARLSPHLHLLLWLSEPVPDNDQISTKYNIAEYIELFCTAILPPDTLTPQESLAAPQQQHSRSNGRAPVYHPLSINNISSSLKKKMSGTERHEFLSRLCNINAFDGTQSSNEELRNQIMASQFHICQSYCLRTSTSCRFSFPIPSQPRASVAIRSGNYQDQRKIALSPRSHPYINSTHPMLAAMFHSNTDVTVVTGNSIAESMYVSSYAVKVNRETLFNTAALRKLQNLKHDQTSNRKLLGYIARSSESVRTVGGQEAVDNLLGNPLTFTSAEVLNVGCSFLLNAEVALSKAQRNETQEEEKTPYKKQIINDLDFDELTMSERKNLSKDDKTFSKTKIHGFILEYMRRPLCLSDLSASEFHKRYRVKNIRTSSRNYEETMKLLNEEKEEIHPSKSKQKGVGYQELS